MSEEKKQQVIALGRLGWSLRRIELETGIRRETISAYLKEAGVTLRLPRGRLVPPKPANEVTPDPEAAKPASCADEVTPDSGAESAAEPVTELESPPSRKTSASVCEPHRETIELGLSKGRNAKAIWQDLVDGSSFAGGYQSVKRFVRNLCGKQSPEACAVIETAPGEDYGKFRVMVRNSFTRARIPQPVQCFSVARFP